MKYFCSNYKPLMRKILIVLILLMLNVFTFAQKKYDFNNYQPIRSSGELPKELTILSYKKYEKEKAKLDKNEKRSERIAKDDFLLENSYLLDELLLSGKVLYNDTIGKYVNKVLDRVLENQPDLQDKVKVYVIKSSSVNAFATNNGTIFVNIGLLTQLENEAQLAYILCHEIIHYKNKHVINSYVESRKIKKGTGVYRGTSLDDRLLAKSNYSKELESESDRAGLDLYLKTNYSLEALNGVFDVLQYAYLPFDLVEFKKDFLENKNLILPEGYFLADSAISPIKGDEDYDDTKSTHPSTIKRRKDILGRIEGKENAGKKKYLVSEEEFLFTRKVARFEVCRLYLLKRQYENALYSAYILLEDDPQNKYLRVTVAKALYGLSKYLNYKNKTEFNEIHVSYKKIEGNSQQVYYFVEKIPKAELNVLALSYAWLLRKEFPNDIELVGITEDLFKEMVNLYYGSISDFYTRPKAEDKPITDSLSAEVPDTVNTSKYQKIKKKKEKEKARVSDAYVKYAFVDLLKDSLFRETFQKYADEKTAAENMTEKQKKDREKKKKKEEEILDKKGYALGINKMVVFDPFYYKIDQRKKNVVQYQAGESGKLAFNEKIQTNARSLSLKTELLEPKRLKEDDVEVLNDIAFLNDWIDEQILHDRINVVPTDQAFVHNFIERYDTRYLCKMGAISVIDGKDGAQFASNFCLAFVLWNTIPQALVKMFGPNYSTHYYAIVFDMETGKSIYTEAVVVNQRDRNDVLNARIYDTLLQIKSRRK
jgi:hypothetical protein